MTKQNKYDVIIVGGSYAGLSAALSLGRALRRVLIIDSARPCNHKAKEAYNFLTHDGSAPADIIFWAKAQVMLYPTIDFVNASVAEAVTDPYGFKIATEEQHIFFSRKLLFATGIRDIIPDIKGLTDCWGISVLQCPYCHGYEYTHEPTGLFAAGAMAFEMAALLRNWTADLTIFSNGPSGLKASDIAKLKEHDIEIIEKEISGVHHENGHLKQIICKDRSEYELAVMYIHPAFEQHCPLPAILGCNITDDGYIEVNEKGKTTVPGVFAAGDATTHFRSIAFAVGNGSVACAFINHELVQEDF